MVEQANSFSNRCLDVSLARAKYLWDLLARKAECSDSFVSLPEFFDEQDHVPHTREDLPLALICGNVCKDDHALESKCDGLC